MRNKLISIIVPVYNVAAYLDRCLESLVNQTYQNLQIIVIDDGSTDGSNEICDKWAAKDRRIYVVHKENKGLSNARNDGLKVAEGEYIGFVDSDDYISIFMYEYLIYAIEKYNADISICNFIEVDINRCEEIDKNKILKIEQVLQNDSNYNKIQNMHGNYVWNKLYKKSILEHEFENVQVHEDVIFNNIAFCRAKKIVYVNEILYYYYWRENSLMKYGTFTEMDVLKADESCIKYADNIKDNKLLQYRLRIALAHIIHAYYEREYMDEENNQKYIKTKLKSYIKEYWNKWRIREYAKIFIFLILKKNPYRLIKINYNGTVI